MPRRLLATSALLLVLGCSRDATVSGTVTYDGKPVEDGFITFYPANQHGVSRGGEIHEGRYSVGSLSPGKMVVRIKSQPRPELIENRKSGGQVLYVRPPAQPIPDGAVGNGAVVELTAGPQTRDFNLQPPGRK